MGACFGLSGFSAVTRLGLFGRHGLSLYLSGLIVVFAVFVAFVSGLASLTGVASLSRFSLFLVGDLGGDFCCLRGDLWVIVFHSPPLASSISFSVSARVSSRMVGSVALVSSASPDFELLDFDGVLELLDSFEVADPASFVPSLSTFGGFVSIVSANLSANFVGAVELVFLTAPEYELLDPSEVFEWSDSLEATDDASLVVFPSFTAVEAGFFPAAKYFVIMAVPVVPVSGFFLWLRLVPVFPLCFGMVEFIFSWFLI